MVALCSLSDSPRVRCFELNFKEHIALQLQWFTFSNCCVEPDSTDLLGCWPDDGGGHIGANGCRLILVPWSLAAGFKSWGNSLFSVPRRPDILAEEKFHEEQLSSTGTQAYDPVEENPRTGWPNMCEGVGRNDGGMEKEKSRKISYVLPRNWILSAGIRKPLRNYKWVQFGLCLTAPFMSKKDSLIAIQTDWRPSNLQTFGSLFQVEKMRSQAKAEAKDLQRRRTPANSVRCMCFSR